MSCIRILLSIFTAFGLFISQVSFMGIAPLSAYAQMPPTMPPPTTTPPPTMPPPTAPICGNSIVESPETCDDGNIISGDGCDATCNVETVMCGNSIVESPETCDDGNTDNADACANDCTSTGIPPAVFPPACGDGIVDTGESCDSGAGDSTTCDSDCTNVSCGDSHLNSSAGESCDDGNTTSNDGCSSTCEMEYCGDGTTNNGEQCDNNAVDSSSCDSNCTNAVCGDSYTNSTASEICDDGNTTNGDGCSSTCQMEMPPMPEWCDCWGNSGSAYNSCDYTPGEGYSSCTNKCCVQLFNNTGYNCD